jgi:hypothetical protein
MRTTMNNLRKSMILGLAGGASLLSAPLGGCGKAGELFQTGWNIGAELAGMMDAPESGVFDESVDMDDLFYGF